MWCPECGVGAVDAAGEDRFLAWLRGMRRSRCFALRLLEDAFVLEARGGCTEMRYESRFAVKAPVIGWLLARLVIGAGDESAHGGPLGGY